ncbi:MAG: glycosyltransferase family 2 protein [Candidatus Brockarchaeota archaeon]|nr:glycosyltransferase family 2 protein [Candidatus Brockarchaeota archaeon]
MPAYNEERTIASVVVKAMRHVDKVIVCDDGSTDLTGEIAGKLGAEVVRHERNMGYGSALHSLFEEAEEDGADIMVTLDADGQHNPDDIPRVIEPILRGEADIVIGSRFLGESGEQIPRYREVGVKAITKLTGKASYSGLTDAQSGFRAYSRKAFEKLKPSEMGMGASTEILVKAHENGFRVEEVPIKIKYEGETSTQNPVSHGLEVVMSTVKYLSMRRPMVFYGLPGVASMLVALFFWLWSLQIFAATRQLSTNIVLIAIVATMVGLMLLTTAVLLWVLIAVIREKK